MIECLARATPAIWRVAYAELKRKPTQSMGAKLPIPQDLAVDHAMKAKPVSYTHLTLPTIYSV